MAILRVIDQHRNTKVTTVHIRDTIDKNAFKIIYVWVVESTFQLLKLIFVVHQWRHWQQKLSENLENVFNGSQ